jgi:putative ABC transport system ATP-binding protein
MLEIRNLRHEYDGRTVLSVPSWSVPKGEASLVIGPSGSGKSTLIAIIAGLLLPSAGEVRVGESEITRLTGVQRDAYRARNIGLAPQTLHLIGVLSVRDNLRLARSLASLPADDALVDAGLASLGVAALARHKARDLSVGEAQRVAIARAVVNRPALILADEPTSALDDANCDKALALLREQAAQCGATLVIATHDRRIRDHFSRCLEL